MFGILLSGLLTVAVSLAMTPLVRDAALRWGLVDSRDSDRKTHKGSIPRLGGIAILFSYIWTLGLLKFLNFGGNIPGLTDLPSWWLGVLAVAVVFATGFIDDIIGLNAWQKVLGQSIAAALAWYSGVAIHALQGQALPNWLSLAATVAWLVVCSNALNLIDGMDGLAAGVGFFSTATMCAAALVHGNMALVAVTLPMCGALLGFLRYNFNPASIFMGDGGSLTIGFLLGCFGVVWSDKSATLLGMTAPVIAMAVPLLDASVSIARRLVRNRPVFAGDRRHIHHRLLDRGFTTTRAVLVMYAACIVAATLSLLANSVKGQFGGLLIILFCALVVVGIQYLGYVEFGTAARMALSGWFRKRVDDQVKLQLFEEQLDRAETIEDCWEIIARAATQFGFVGIRLKLGDRHFEQVIAPTRRQWQARIDLDGGSYLNFYCPLDGDAEFWTASEFVRALETRLMGKLLSLKLSEAQLRLVKKSVSEQPLSRAV